VVELVVLACLVTRPQLCEERLIPFLRPMVVGSSASKADSCTCA